MPAKLQVELKLVSLYTFQHNLKKRYLQNATQKKRYLRNATKRKRYLRNATMS